MTKKEKVKRLMELVGLNNKFKAIIDVVNEDGDIKDKKFLKFLYKTVVSAHIEIFQKNFSESDMDNLISFFSNSSLQESLKLINRLSDEALEISDAKVQKFIEEERLMDYAQHEADQGGYKLVIYHFFLPLLRRF